MIVKIERESKYLFAKEVNYLVIDSNSNIIGAYITKREAEAQQRNCENVKDTNDKYVDFVS